MEQKSIEIQTSRARAAHPDPAQSDTQQKRRRARAAHPDPAQSDTQQRRRRARAAPYVNVRRIPTWMFFSQTGPESSTNQAP